MNVQIQAVLSLLNVNNKQYLYVNTSSVINVDIKSVIYKSTYK